MVKIPLRERLVPGDRLLRNGKLYNVSSVNNSLFIYRDSMAKNSIYFPFEVGIRYIKDIPDYELETYLKIKVYDGKPEIVEESKGSSDG